MDGKTKSLSVTSTFNEDCLLPRCAPPVVNCSFPATKRLNARQGFLGFRSFHKFCSESRHLNYLKERRYEINSLALVTSKTNSFH